MENGRNGFIKSLSGMACLSALGGEVKSQTEVESAKCKFRNPEFNDSYFMGQLSLNEDFVQGRIKSASSQRGLISWEGFYYRVHKRMFNSLMNGRMNEFLKDVGVNYPRFKYIQQMKNDLEGVLDGYFFNWTNYICPSEDVGVKSTNVQVRVFKVNGEDGKYKYVEWWGVSITRNDGYVVNSTLSIFDQTNGAIEKDIDYTFLTTNGLLKEVNESEL